MNLEFMLLANYAEVNSNLLYIQGGGWDTITIGAPLPREAFQGLPPDTPTPFALLQGTLVIRIAFHQTEAGRDYTFTLHIIDDDGGEAGKAEGSFRVQAQPGLPATWPINVQIPLPLTGIALPRPGHYTLALAVNGQHLGEKLFRIIKGY